MDKNNKIETVSMLLIILLLGLTIGIGLGRNIPIKTHKKIVPSIQINIKPDETSDTLYIYKRVK